MHRSSIVRTMMAGLAVSAIAACVDAGSNDTNAAKTAAEVRTNIATITAAYNAHDADKAVSFDAPGYVGMFHGSAAVVGPAADHAAMKEQFKDPAARFDVNVQSVDVSKVGDMAVVRALYQYTFTDPKTTKLASERGSWVAGFKRQSDGSLRLAWTIGADAPAAPVAGTPKT